MSPKRSFRRHIVFALFLDFFNFYIGGHFEMAAILKILITKSTTLSDDLFLCQDSKGSAVRFEFNIFCTLVTMAMVAILNFFQPPKRCHIFLQSFMKGIKKNLNPPFFVSMATAARFVQPIPIFLAFLVPLDVDVVNRSSFKVVLFVIKIFKMATNMKI
jgi:hypothetical protein